MPIPETIYYESHVTIDPVEDILVLQEICDHYRFKIAKLFMRKGETLLPSDIDMFMTAHGSSFEEIEHRMKLFVTELNLSGFVVRRSKIEAVIVDSRPYRG